MKKPRMFNLSLAAFSFILAIVLFSRGYPNAGYLNLGAAGLNVGLAYL
jgi:hypothetical protein